MQMDGWKGKTKKNKERKWPKTSFKDKKVMNVKNKWDCIDFDKK